MWRRLLTLSAVMLVGITLPVSAHASSSTRFDWTGVVGDMQPRSSTVTLYVGAVAETILWTPSTQITGGTLAALTPGTIVEVPGQLTSSANVATAIRILREATSTSKAKAATLTGSVMRVASSGVWIALFTASGRVDVTTQAPNGLTPTIIPGQVVTFKGVQLGSAFSASDASFLPVPPALRLKSKPAGSKTTLVAVAVAGQRDLWEIWTATGFIAVTLDPATIATGPLITVGQKLTITGIATGSQLWATSVATASSDN